MPACSGRADEGPVARRGIRQLLWWRRPPLRLKSGALPEPRSVMPTPESLATPSSVTARLAFAPLSFFCAPERFKDNRCLHK